MELSNQEAILNFIFSPHSGVSFSGPAPAAAAAPLKSDLPQEQIDAKIKEKEAVDLAEQGNINESILLLNDLISSHPSYASAYNNRAQAYRLQEKWNESLADCNTSISLCEDASTDIWLPSDRRSALLCQSLTQRALVHRALSLEAESLADFARVKTIKASQCKDSSENAYAKMCHSAVQEMLRFEMCGNSDK
eukprot:TRINITY_DN5567_c0_g1_i1.p1 TRINITY_DN5567_c0_g1~~TRINITY_DN5567_c0_g1_i1.p1  ORF type:complete len:213 (-),score=71.43 TRINITY_DN5567_c0_g1_i1:51-629(-)